MRRSSRRSSILLSFPSVSVPGNTPGLSAGRSSTGTTPYIAMPALPFGPRMMCITGGRRRSSLPVRRHSMPPLQFIQNTSRAGSHSTIFAAGGLDQSTCRREFGPERGCKSTLIKPNRCLIFIDTFRNVNKNSGKSDTSNYQEKEHL